MTSEIPLSNSLVPGNGVTFRIADIIAETTDTKTFVLQPLSSENIPYKPGQYLVIEIFLNGRALRRTYSLSSTSGIDPEMTITVKRIANGEVSRYLHDHAQKGELVNGLWPGGRFVFDDEDETPMDLFLVAAGSGITPVFAILKHVLYQTTHVHVKLIYSNSSMASCIFHDQLRELEKAFPEKLQVTWLFSNSKNLSHARLNRDLLEHIIKTQTYHAKERSLFYTCGPYEYMHMIQVTVLTLGYTEEQYRKETFVIPDIEGDDDDEGAPEKTYEAFDVGITVMGQHHLVYVDAGESILDAALRNHITLPYSCKSGICSTCTASLTRGTVYMHNNEVLTEKEIANGRILTCTGHPESSDVEIVY